VELILTNTDPSDPANLTLAVPTTTASGWMVRTVDQTVYVDGKNMVEGGRGTSAPVSVSGCSVALSALTPQAPCLTSNDISGVTFTALGGTTLATTLAATATAAKFAFTNPEGGACVSDTPPGPMRCLNVIVSTTGRVKFCDPATVAPDTRACT
jgi:hypothetical protein